MAWLHREPSSDWFKRRVIERGYDSADVREFWQAVARKSAHQEVVSNIFLALMFATVGAAMLTGLFTWIRWLLNAL